MPRRRARRSTAASEFQPQWNAVPAERRAELLERAALARRGRRRRARRALRRRDGPNRARRSRRSPRGRRSAALLRRRSAARGSRQPRRLPGPTGERNELAARRPRRVRLHQPVEFPGRDLHGPDRRRARGRQHRDRETRGAGVADRRAIVERLLRAGLPPGALQFLPGDGAALGAALLGDPRVAGVAFTGSVETARAINRALAQRERADRTLIAETGGINAMIVDSSALPEQVVRDAAQSAFDSAGQRCSALRLLCLQEEIADEVLRPLDGLARRARDRRSGAARHRRRARHRSRRAGDARPITSRRSAARSCTNAVSTRGTRAACSFPRRCSRFPPRRL